MRGYRLSGKAPGPKLDVMKTWQPEQPVSGPALWQGGELARTPERWTWSLSDAAVREIERAAEVARGHGFDAVTLPDDPDAFPLPGLAGLFDEMGGALRDGTGVALLRGLPIDGRAPAETELVLRGIGAQLGVCVSQNHRGERVGRVMDVSDEMADPRRYQAGGEFRMHIDPIDIVGLLCVRKAKEGGESQVVSSAAVHNTVLAERPDLIGALYDGYRLFRPPADRGDAPPLTAAPVPVFAADTAGRFATYFLPDPVHQAEERAGEVPSDMAREALAFADAVAQRPSLVLEMDLVPGDLQLLNNRAVLHGRTDYLDHADTARRRLMLRLWLMARDWPALSPRQRFFDDYDKLGGGIPARAAE